MPRRPRGQHAIHHVDAEAGIFDDFFRRAHSHQIARLVGGQDARASTRRSRASARAALRRSARRWHSRESRSRWSAQPIRVAGRDPCRPARCRRETESVRSTSGTDAVRQSAERSSAGSSAAAEGPRACRSAWTDGCVRPYVATACPRHLVLMLLKILLAARRPARRHFHRSPHARLDPPDTPCTHRTP